MGAAVAFVILAGCQSTELPRVAVAAAPLPVPSATIVPPKAPSKPLPPPAPAALIATVNELARGFDGKVGIAVRSIDRDWQVAANGDLPLPQQSVSKLWVAMAVLDARDQGRLTLDDPVTVTREDLTLFHQPIAAMVKGDGYKTTVSELLQRALTQSDNTANDRLLRFVGGPDAVRDFVRRKQLGTIRFGPGERLLQSQTAGLQWQSGFATGNSFIRARAQLPIETRVKAFDAYIADPPDGAAPVAIAGALAKLKRGTLLSPSSTQYLISTMESSKTGRQRLRGAVPEGWSVGHKTGTGQDLAGRTAGYNDVGILVAPDGRSYAIAVMIGDTPRPVAERQALMQSVVAAVVANHS
ncbi:MAG: class A beta-lactamase [Sphingomonas sp.]|nr:class A beta-lactamase [Sphingomonas sp.]MBY0283289.1 class A beta-lactamase [Sphingomonas sp.]